MFIFLISFISAQHPICDQDDDPSTQGVYINGVCYDCGLDDLVCPENYGADCGSILDPDCPVTTQAFWSLDESTAINQLLVLLPDGTDVFLVVKNTGLEDGEEVSFDVFENDFLLDDDITSLTTTVSDGKAVATWKVIQDDLDETEEGDYDEFYFVADGDGLDISTRDREDAYEFLNITTTFTGSVISQCADYLDNVSCEADAETVASGASQRDEDGCIYFLDWNCMWLEGSCDLGSSETASEENAPSCDAANTNPCVYEQTEKQGDCEGGDDFFKVSYSSTQTECESWVTGPIPCPAQVKLGFFSMLNIIASLSIISVIYGFLLSRQ